MHRYNLIIYSGSNPRGKNSFAFSRHLGLTSRLRMRRVEANTKQTTIHGSLPTFYIWISPSPPLLFSMVHESKMVLNPVRYINPPHREYRLDPSPQLPQG